MSTHREVETTYAPGADAEVPDLGALDAVHQVRSEPAVELDAVYLDTAGLVLTRAGVSLRRRTGGADEGWHLKVPAGGARLEIRRPLGRATARPPRALLELVVGWTRGAEVAPVATITTHRSRSLLLDGRRTVLAELADDEVTASTPDGAVVRWREWELELVEGGPDLLADADRLLADAGVAHAGAARKIDRMLGDRAAAPAPPPRPRRTKPVARLVRARLAEQLEVLALSDVGARQGDDGAVHDMRLACRRLRALLATFRPVLERDVTDPLRGELHWLAGVLGRARDAAVVHDRLRGLVDDEPRSLVHGPVRRRLRSTYDGRGKPELRAALGSPRYLRLRERLDRLAAEPPWTGLAAAPARDVAPRRLRKELERFRRRAEAAATADDAAAALHAARKAAKRLRYAAEAVEPVGGKAARRLVRDARRVTSRLGELQDTVVSRSELVGLARAADAAGEPTFVYGRLHAREEARAERAASAYEGSDAMGALRAGTKKARAAVRKGG